MMMKVLSPGMQHRQKAEPGAKVPGVGGDLQQGFGGGPEEQAIQQPLVLQCSGAISWGNVNTTWKYSTGSSSAARCSSHRALARPWHLGQWRLRHEQYEICR